MNNPRFRAVRQQPSNLPGMLPPTSRKQALFEEKVKMYAKHGIITTPGYLRCEFNHLGATVSAVNWAVTENQSTGTAPNVTERRLKISDSFTVMNMAYYLGYVKSSTYSAAAWAKMNLLTFPNPTTIPGSGEADNHQAFYNGFLSLRVDNTVFVDSYPMYGFYRVGTAQKGTGGGGTGFVLTQADEFDSQMFGQNSITPSIELNGQSNIQISSQLPQPVATTVTPTSGSASTVSVLILQGFLHQGAAKNQQARF